MSGWKHPHTAITIVMFSVAISMPGLVAAVAAGPKSPPLQKTASYGGYTVNTYFDPDSNAKDAYYEILKDSKRIYRYQASERGEKFVIGTLYDDDPDARLVAIGRDITGDGKPDLVISEWTGGANCCLIFHLFEIGPKFRKIGSVDAEYGDQGPHFFHMTKRAGLQIQVYDFTFANWHSDFAESPAPRVILRYERGRYRVASDLMCTASVDMDHLAARIQKIRTQTKELHGGSWPDADIPPAVWATMLDLIYSCHRLQAWLFVDEAWPKKVDGEENFITDFTNQLKKSPYWSTVSQLGT